MKTQHYLSTLVTLCTTMLTIPCTHAQVPYAKIATIALAGSAYIGANLLATKYIIIPCLTGLQKKQRIAYATRAQKELMTLHNAGYVRIANISHQSHQHAVTYTLELEHTNGELHRYTAHYKREKNVAIQDALLNFAQIPTSPTDATKTHLYSLSLLTVHMLATLKNTAQKQALEDPYTPCSTMQIAHIISLISIIMNQLPTWHEYTQCTIGQFCNTAKERTSKYIRNTIERILTPFVLAGYVLVIAIIDPKRIGLR